MTESVRIVHLFIIILVHEKTKKIKPKWTDLGKSALIKMPIRQKLIKPKNH